MKSPLKSTPGCPKTGWEWVRVVDLHDDEGKEYGDYEECEYCTKEQIRYVHYLRHPDWKNTISVGCICASLLTGNGRAEEEEQRLRKLAQRRTNFLRLKSWRTSAKGNMWIEYQDHHIIIVRLSPVKYRLRIDGQLGKLTFSDKQRAMLRAFDVVMQKVSRGC